MSSLGTLAPHDPGHFRWHSGLDARDYVMAAYEVTAALEGAAAAAGMAMEQSVTTTRIHDLFDPAVLEPWSIRVVRVARLPDAASAGAGSFMLGTPVFGDGSVRQAGTFLVELAVPLRLLQGQASQLLNILVGELPRLGFLTRFRLLSARLPGDFGPGPAFGMPGLRRLAGRPHGPLLCRSMRPAVGLDEDSKALLHRQVLEGGFHVVKDDELESFADASAYELHLRSVLRARDAAREVTGERKLYFANLICDHGELEERWELCCRLGVDGVLVAPWIQGLGTLKHLASRRRLPLLAHNTGVELLSRHPDWQVTDEVLFHWLRACGADLVVTRGSFGNPGGKDSDPIAHVEPVLGDCQGRLPMVPILQGGKTPADLPAYRAAVGSDDFMLIVASWVDNHPDGVAAGARCFRKALGVD